LAGAEGERFIGRLVLSFGRRGLYADLGGRGDGHRNHIRSIDLRTTGREGE